MEIIRDPNFKSQTSKSVPSPLPSPQRDCVAKKRLWGEGKTRTFLMRRLRFAKKKDPRKEGPCPDFFKMITYAKIQSLETISLNSLLHHSVTPILQ
jgi:hypothetical protein